MIRAYPEEVSIEPGERPRLHVEGDAALRGLRFYRAGAAFEPVAEPSRPGAYVVQCVTGAGEPPLSTCDARAGAALFVVRRPGAKLTVNLPLFTYHAYNVVEPGGACLYTGPTRVSLHRPGGGIGGRLWDEGHADVYDPSSPRQTFAHWDAKALAWLEAFGEEVDVCTDLDLHRGRLSSTTRLLLAFGHQEYWTREMRATIVEFLERGGNVALLCGNTSWFRLRFDPARNEIVRDGKWSDDEPEEELIGTSYRFGGGRWHGERPPTGYTVLDGAHWIFEGTGLRAGDTFGARHRLVGYECDAPRADDEQAVAAASLDRWEATDGCGEVLGGRAALVVRRYGYGTIVNAGTTDWARLLACDPQVARITANVVRRLG